ncbi:hypothetical protein KBB12_04155 [Candidatus Woesebacteria bacterium]|nr:hypothetical protein [Candidatus Woesebacteria bacterium]
MHPKLHVAMQSKSVWQARPSTGTVSQAPSAIPPNVSLQFDALGPSTFGVVSPVGLGRTGHISNSQFGKTLPTYVPLGHIFASAVHPTFVGEMVGEVVRSNND